MLRLLTRAALAFTIIALAGASRADLTADIRTTYDFSKMTIMGQPVSPMELMMIKRMPLFTNGGIDMTICQGGKNVKVDTPIASTIVDLDAKTTTMLYADSKQYTVQPLMNDQAKEMLGSMDTNVRDMDQTKTMQGHVCHLYRVYMRSPKMSMLGYVWIATDLPSLADSVTGSLNLKSLSAKVKGFPMKLDADMNMPSLFGTIGFHYEVNSVNTNPVDASVFAIPPGYTERKEPEPANPGQT